MTHKKAGFSLLEMAIVLLVVGIFDGGWFGSAQCTNQPTPLE
ncbi:prepilin-type N-terminal cleavage/methylation domain-containing protein [Deefgea sp. CFH1-16]